MARLFVAHVEGGKQDPMAGVADAIEERRRRQVEEQTARDQLALQNTALDLERQGLRLQRYGIAQQGVRLGMELEAREKVARIGEEGATRRQESAQTFQSVEAEEARDFAAGESALERGARAEESQATRDFQGEQAQLQRDATSAEKAADRLAASDALDRNLQAQMVQLDKQIEAAKAEGDSQREAQLNLQKNQLEATAQENDKNRKASFKAARQERKAEMARLQKQIDSAEKIAADRIKTELEALDKEIQSRYSMQAAELRDAKEARDDERVARATAQMREIEAQKAAQERAIKANKEQYQNEAASAASRQLRALEAEEKENEKQRRFAGKQKELDREFTSGESSRDRLFRGGQAQEDRDQQLAILDAQIAAAREEGKKDRESRLVLQRQQLEAAKEEGALDRAARRESDTQRIGAQMQIAEMQYGMPGGMAQQTVDTLNAQVESLDRIFDSLPEGQRPPAAARQRGKEQLAAASQGILTARTKEEYNAAVANAGQLYRSYQEEMQAAGQAVFTGRQNDRYNELMEWAGSDLGREHGITEARLAEVVTGDPSKRAEDISNLVAMKRGAQAYRRAELALDQLEEGGNTRIEGLKEVMGGIAPDGTYDSSKLNPVQKLAAEAFAGMNDVGLSMTERAQAAQTLMRYANMTEDDEKFVSMTLESERQERSAMDLERNANWVRSALAGPDAEFREQDIMEPDFQDRLAALAAGSAGPNKRGIAKAASIALGIITQQDFATLGDGGYRQLWAEIGTQLDPRVLQQLGRELQAVDFSMPSSAAPSGPVGQKLQRMKDNLTGTQQ